MTLFESGISSVQKQPRRGAGRTFGSWALSVAVIAGVVFALLPSPYVIEQPGPVFNTLGTQKQGGKDQSLISVNDAPSYPTSGALNLLTVSILGQPERTPEWLDVLSAWFDNKRTVLPVEEIYPPGISDSQQNQLNTQMMVDSQQEAIAAALRQLGYEIGDQVTIAETPTEGPASGLLEANDIVTAINGTLVKSITELRAAVKANGEENPATVSILHGDQTKEVQITPIKQQDAVILGIAVKMQYTFPVKVTISLNDVGGPSAGMMFALGIIDKLTPGEMTGGKNFAGTGTIDAAGKVGAIGGIREKMWGAEKAGAKLFLAPQANCDEVVGHIPDGMRVFAVKDLTEARTVVETLGSGKESSSLPSCETAK